MKLSPLKVRLNLKEREHAILNHLGVGVVIHAPDTSVILSNPLARDLLGLNEREMLGKKANNPNWNFVKEDGLPLKVDQYPVSLIANNQEQIKNLVLGIKRPDKAEVTWVSINGFRYLDSNENFILNDLVKDIIEILNPKALSKNLKIIMEIEPEVPSFLIGDYFRLKQVLMNLVGNSIKFTQEGSIQINISLNTNKKIYGDILFKIIDTGIGISEEQQKKLFQIYSQADSSTTKAYGGTGLGLAICKKIIEKMGGEISMHSKLNEGTTISFTILNSSLELKIKEKVKEKVLSRKDISEMLVVDDVEVNRLLIKEYLKNSCFHITEAESGDEAVLKTQKGNFDIILMDMQMPIMDGYTATKEIRNWEKTTKHIRTPIIAFSAYAMKEEKEKSLEAGCDINLSKPILKESLMEVLHKFIY